MLRILVFMCLLVVGIGAIPQPDTDDLIQLYHNMGKVYRVIPAYLWLCHGIFISFAWLKHRLAFLGLRRKNVETRSVVATARSAIQKELKSANCCIGYRLMWQVLKIKYNLKVKRTTVMMLLATLDPEGTQLRRQRRLHRRVYINKGPNFTWHLDGYDKLSPYGFNVHGCIDGYSRRIVWLKVTPSNHDPKVILSLYMDAVAETGGCPTLLLSDYGTENRHIASTHMALRHFHNDPWNGSKSFKYGKSTTNTRIEGFWSLLRRLKTGWWIEKFQGLVSEGTLNPSSVEHRHCLCYVYGTLLVKDIEEFVVIWNTHRMRANKNTYCPQGVPDDLYHLPVLHGTVNYLKSPVNLDVFAAAARSHYHMLPPLYPLEFGDAMDALLLETLNLTKHNINVCNFDTIFRTLSSVLL